MPPRTDVWILYVQTWKAFQRKNILCAMYQHPLLRSKTAYPNSQPCLMYLETVENNTPNASFVKASTPKSNREMQSSLFTSPTIIKTPGSASRSHATIIKTNTSHLQEAPPMIVSGARVIPDNRGYNPPVPSIPFVANNYFPNYSSNLMSNRFSQPAPPVYSLPVFQTPVMSTSFYHMASPSRIIGTPTSSIKPNQAPPSEILLRSPQSPGFDATEMSMTTRLMAVGSPSQLSDDEDKKSIEIQTEVPRNEGTPSLHDKAKKLKEAECQLEEFLLKSRENQERMQAMITAKRCETGRLSTSHRRSLSANAAPAHPLRATEPASPEVKHKRASSVMVTKTVEEEQAPLTPHSSYVCSVRQNAQQLAETRRMTEEQFRRLRQNLLDRSELHVLTTAPQN